MLFKNRWRTGRTINKWKRVGGPKGWELLLLARNHANVEPSYNLKRTILGRQFAPSGGQSESRRPRAREARGIRERKRWKEEGGRGRKEEGKRDARWKKEELGWSRRARSWLPARNDDRFPTSRGEGTSSTCLLVATMLHSVHYTLYAARFALYTL